ncbi:hypothetical protein JQ615_31080 [Bradyrhizobium jicamae]|uniref:Uncharacterized protein n=1 Tax=Bradyrhizobium jicamae TaxID=280332 RepID=A0ABS5FST2_9BRAD|nr:hypothetical protein [Bradyrhizobium jicamae]MBR0799823.1 hypothetical protein [Bradyrhizobium jicamae]
MLARFTRSGIGARGEDARLFVLDLIGEKNLKGIDPAGVKSEVTAEKSEVKNIVTQLNPYAVGGG